MSLWWFQWNSIKLTNLKYSAHSEDLGRASVKCWYFANQKCLAVCAANSMHLYSYSSYNTAQKNLVLQKTSLTRALISVVQMGSHKSNLIAVRYTIHCYKWNHLIRSIEFFKFFHSPNCCKCILDQSYSIRTTVSIRLVQSCKSVWEHPVQNIQ